MALDSGADPGKNTGLGNYQLQISDTDPTPENFKITFFTNLIKVNMGMLYLILKLLN